VVSLDYAVMPLLDCSMHMTKTQFFRFVSSDDFISSVFGPFCIRKYMFPMLLNLRMQHQVSVNDEGRDMWKVYLDMKEYAAALANCRDPLQRDQVYLLQVISSCFYCIKLLVVLIVDFYCNFWSHNFMSLRSAYIYLLNLFIWIVHNRVICGAG
jgi:hypothetical protein